MLGDDDTGEDYDYDTDEEEPDYENDPDLDYDDGREESDTVAPKTQVDTIVPKQIDIEEAEKIIKHVTFRRSAHRLLMHCNIES